MSPDRLDLYKAAALTGLLSGVYFNVSGKDEIEEEDLNYLNELCDKIALKMVCQTINRG